MTKVQNILDYTNVQIAASNYPEHNKGELSKGELFKWIGIRLAMTLTPLRGGVDSYFEVGSEEGTVYQGGNYGARFGMSKARFKCIMAALSFGPSEPTPDGDPWFPIRPLINGFNDRMKSVLIPGTFFCIDECMSMWKGRCHLIAGDEGLPHKTKIARKPEGVGAEFKSLADAETSCILVLDPMEGADRNALKEYNNLGAGIGTCLRLTKPWHGTNRVLTGDSWFACFMAAFHLWNHGLFFIGIVKTASKYFPKTFLTRWCAENNARANRGRYKLLETKKEGVDIYALGWSDKKDKQIVFTTGTTLPAEPSVRKRHKRVEVNGRFVSEPYYKIIPRPMVVKELFDAFSVIDVDDHYRQGSLELERTWIVRDWVLRIFMTILGIIIVNAFYAFLYISGKEPTFNEFLGRLSYQLIHNKFLTQELRELRPRAPGVGIDQDRDEGLGEPHRAALLSTLEMYSHVLGTNKRAARKCKTCKARTAWYCVQCSQPPDYLICYCNGNTDRNCFHIHEMV